METPETLIELELMPNRQSTVYH